ncbi:MAG: hypothetical protein M0R74_01795 [Dehalococcoidia bacterium]|nr:hypothetical protein [Dehalococcoidia bacterium]
MATPSPQGQDIQLEPPTARHADVTPAVEDRSYIGYVASALVIALAAGFLLAVIVPLTATGTLPWDERLPQLVQAHGWAQLQGWAGLFVAGMAMRLIPRFAGRPPIPVRVTLPVLVLLVVGVVWRTIAQSFFTGTLGEVSLVVSGVIAAGGTLSVSAVLAVTLAKGRKRREPWRYFAWAGTAWWAAWGVLMVPAAIRAADNGRFIPLHMEDVLTWLVIFGAVGNFVWSVQSRSVPVFFGRKTPPIRKVVVPGVLLNAGAALIVLSLLDLSPEANERLLGAGFVLAGGASAWLAPIAGSVWGEAHRLRPRARAAARYVLAANVATLLGGVLLAWSGAASMFSGEFELFGFRDAARHAFGLGMITMLIFGMAQLVAPMFALARAEARPPRLSEVLPFWLLVTATLLRILSGLLLEVDSIDLEPRMHTASLAGAMAWVAIALFASTVVRAVRSEPRMKELLGFPARPAR